ncbi:MAG: tetratricopeptide repeat protein [Candidatus Latescibacterota bacterium]
MHRPWHAVLIVAAGALTFHNTFGNSFHYDDGHTVVDNPHVRSLAGVPRLFLDAGTFSAVPEARMYRPLVQASYAVNHALGGADVAGYHALNLALHLLNALLVWVLAGLLLGDEAASLAAGLLFAVHPLACEPVNYISARSASLATFFVLAGVWAVLGLVRRGPTPGRLGLLAGAYAAGLLSKEIAVALPGLALLCLGLGRHGDAAHAAVRPLPARSALVVLGGLTLLYLAGTHALIGRSLQQAPRGLGPHLLTQAKAGVFYLWKAAMPVGLSVEPAFRVAAGPAEAAVASSALLLGSLGFLLWWGRRHCGLLVLAAGWFLLGLLPTFLVPLNVLVNENRLYLPLTGLALAAAGLFATSRRGRGLAVGLLAATLGLLSVQRNAVWRSDETLWADAVAKGPGMPRPHVNLGQALLAQGRAEEAIAASLGALELDPGLALAHYNLGTAHLGLGHAETAVAYYRRALELRPDLVQAHVNLGNAYLEQGRPADAVACYRRALERQPHPSLHHNLGSAYLTWGRPDSAAACFRRALALDPGRREAHAGLVRACLEQRAWADAAASARSALGRWPGDAGLLRLAGEAAAGLGRQAEALDFYRRAGVDAAQAWAQLAQTSLLRGELAQARAQAEQAVAARPASAAAQLALGEALCAQGAVAAGLEALRQAARLEPGRSGPYAAIGRVWLEHGQWDEAMAALERAAELAPQQAQMHALLGQARWQAGRAWEAEAAYRRALALDAGHAGAAHNLGYILAQRGQAQEAEDLYRRALERDPELTEALYNLGFLELEQGRYAEAAAVFAQVRARQPERAAVYLNLASAQRGLGDLEGAAASLQAFLALVPATDPLRDDALRQLHQTRRRLDQGR